MGESLTRFPPIERGPRLSDEVARLLLERILADRLTVGARLPSERELGVQFGVSRTVIREAVGALTAKGVIEVHSGSGLRVAAVGAETASESMRLYLRTGPVEFAEVHEVRQTLEVHLAGLAAERATAVDVATLDAIHRQMASNELDLHEMAQGDLKFHRQIALATHNTLFLVLMDSIGSSVFDIQRDNLESGSAPDTVAQHARILDSVRANDIQGSRSAMTDHLESVAAWWSGRLPA